MDIKNISKNLVSLRNEYGLSQKKMAEVINVSISTYCRMEKGTSNIQLPLLIYICNKFDIKADYLLKDPFYGEYTKPYKTEKEKLIKLTCLQLELLPKESYKIMYELAIILGKKIPASNYIEKNI